MSKESIKLKLECKVLSHYVDDEGKRVFKLEPIKECAITYLVDLIGDMEYTGNNFPVKEDEEGNELIKCSSAFNIACRNLPSGYEVDEIGAGSVGVFYFNIKSGSYKRSHYVSAYVSGIDLSHFEERIEYNPFTDEEFTEI